MKAAFPLRVVLLVTLFVCAALAGCTQEATWSGINDKIRADFPEVEQITTDSLATWLSQAEEPPLLLDVRASDEYAVSHLEGAQRVDPDATDFTFLGAVPRDTPIVTYCSVGYRSSELAKRLQEAGFTNVANLEGSIFRWANDGHPVYRQQTQVAEVHPYDSLWARLLHRRLRAYAPSTATRN